MTQIIAIPGAGPDNYYELRCNAFTIQGPTLTSVVESWNKLKPQVNQYADAVIKGIYHKRTSTDEISQSIEQMIY